MLHISRAPSSKNITGWLLLHCELATLDIKAIWEMQYFFDTAWIQQCANYWRYCSNLFVIQLQHWFFLQSSLLFQYGKKAIKTYYSLPYVSVITGNILVTIIRFDCYDLRACFQWYFHDWFSVLRYNSELAKLEWTPLLFNFK